ncbi:MAG: mitochondrial fission ELM1 family protein [Akkermansiaceae bacterium]|nr:mitochondrial fission ELM1 family protein [Luteolibacter sp.]
MRASLHILVVSDGKAGHENQSLGLAEAMARRVHAEIHLVRVDVKKNIWCRVSEALELSRKFPKPDFVISAGSSTHIVLWWLARKFDARSIVLMKPFLPMALFDWCVAPEHDFKSTPDFENLIISKGALNRVIPVEGDRSEKIFLIGGPSKIHGFDEKKLIEQICEITRDGTWQVADSRRTPGDFLKRLENKIPNLTIFPHQDTKPGWLAGKLSTASEVWVTEDSVSMVYEALTGGAKVGVLDMPRLKPEARVIRGLEKLKEDGYLIGGAEKNMQALAEADRCAGVILGS